jgi:hypothetical protein
VTKVKRNAIADLPSAISALDDAGRLEGEAAHLQGKAAQLRKQAQAFLVDFLARLGLSSAPALSLRDETEKNGAVSGTDAGSLNLNDRLLMIVRECAPISSKQVTQEYLRRGWPKSKTKKTLPDQISSRLSDLKKHKRVERTPDGSYMLPSKNSE